MTKQPTRRDLLRTIGATATLTLAGCIGPFGNTLESQWEDEDEFPDDEDRNRSCDIVDLSPVESEIEPVPYGPRYQPFAYSISGREDLHGTNQHADITLKASDDVNIFVTDNQNASEEHFTAYTGNDEPESDPGGFDPLEDHTTTETQNYQDLLTIPDDAEYTIIAIPPNPQEFWENDDPINIELQIDCSYYLPFEEYEERHSE